MAKKQEVVKLPIKIYRVVSDKVGKTLGPYPVKDQGDRRVVTLNEKQAKFYLTQGVISES